MPKVSEINCGGFRNGKRVIHSEYGAGVIVDAHARNGWIIVDFDNGPLDAKCASVRLKLF